MIFIYLFAITIVSKKEFLTFSAVSRILHYKISLLRSFLTRSFVIAQENTSDGHALILSIILYGIAQNSNLIPVSVLRV